VDVEVAVPSGRCLHVEAMASETMASNNFMGRGGPVGDHEWCSNFVSIMRRGCRLDGCVLVGSSMSRRRPQMRCGGHGLRVVALCSLGCGQLGCAALQLESERWYVGAVALEGGIGGSRRA
jgi:hypothetical protein